MSRLFIYYSNTGNGDYVANILKSKGFTTLKVEPVEELPKLYIFKLLVGGFSAFVNDKPKLKNDIISMLNVVRAHNEIYIGTPVWNGRVCPPINTVMEELKHKKFSIICYSKSGKIKKLIKQVKKYNVENIISLVEPLKNNEDAYEILNKQL